MATETSITRQAPYIEALGEQYGKDLTALTAKKMPTATYAPTVAGQDKAQQDAYTMATTQGQGIGAYQPYITQAAAYTGPSAYQPFMSPYQQQVIKETLDQYDIQAKKGLAGIGQQAAMSGNLGGGREGVMRAQYQSNQDANRALLNAKLLTQGFNQANLNAQKAFDQQGRLAGDIQDYQTADINQLGRLGGVNQLQEQAELDAQREANRLEAFEPYERLNTYGSGVASLFSGNAPFGSSSTVTPNPTPLQTALGTASVLSGIFGGGNQKDTSGYMKYI